MTKSDFTSTLLVEQTPHEVFNAIVNVRGWWSEEIEGSTAKKDDEFLYRYEDVHRCKIRLIDVVPDKKIVWLVMSNYFNFTKDTGEWTDTKISFEISKKGSETELRFQHIGLVPEFECFEICSKGWTHYIQGSLRDLITTGKGKPNATGRPTTEDEKQLTNEQKL